MENCTFCNIVKGYISCKKVYENDEFLSFYDINPKASIHILVIPKLHIESLLSLKNTHYDIIAKLTLLLPKIATKNGLINGFRTIINSGPDAKQEINHLHYHILGGNK